MTEDFVKPKKTKFDRKKIGDKKRKTYSEEDCSVEFYSRKQKHKVDFLAQAEEDFDFIEKESFKNTWIVDVEDGD